MLRGRLSRVWLGASLLAAAVLLAGCSSDPPRVGSLGSGGDSSQACLAYSRGIVVAAGFWNLDNTGKSPVTITGITLPGTRHLRMATKAFLVPIAYTDGEYLQIGDGGRWPPHDGSVARGQWKQRVPLIGAVLRPGQERNLVVGIVWTAGPYGISDGPKITYMSAGHTYTVTEQLTLAISATCNNVPS